MCWLWKKQDVHFTLPKLLLSCIWHSFYHAAQLACSQTQEIESTKQPQSMPFTVMYLHNPRLILLLETNRGLLWPVTTESLADAKVWMFLFIEMTTVNNCNQCHTRLPLPLLVMTQRMKKIRSPKCIHHKMLSSLTPLAASTIPRRIITEAQTTKAPMIAQTRMTRVMLPMRRMLRMELMTFKSWTTKLLHQPLPLK